MENKKSQDKKNFWIGFYLLARSNYSSTVLPAMCVTISQLFQKTDVLPIEVIVSRFLGCFLYASLYVLQFNLGNQINGIEEDEINKKHRAIPSGRISRKTCQTLSYWIFCIYFLVGIFFGLQWETIVWLFSSFLHNYTNIGKSGLWKNLLMFPGTVVLLLSPLRIANGWDQFDSITVESWAWVLCCAFLATLIVPIQDIRDIEGDRAVGRKTFPIVFGLENTIRFFIIVPPLCCIISILFEYYVFPIHRIVSFEVFHLFQCLCFFSISYYLIKGLRSMKDVAFAYGFCLLMWLNIYCLFSPKIEF